LAFGVSCGFARAFLCIALGVSCAALLIALTAFCISLLSSRRAFLFAGGVLGIPRSISIRAALGAFLGASCIFGGLSGVFFFLAGILFGAA
jgi:hypothetical protein